MNKTESELFRQALTEAFVRKYERELAECPESAHCSEVHMQRVNEMINQSVESDRRKDRRKWIVALLVAAALLLSALTVGAYYKEIQAFVEQIYKDHIRLTFNGDSQVVENEELELRYTLGYVPEGYTLKRQELNKAMTYCEWRNAYGEYLIYKQNILNGVDFFLNSEIGESSILSLDKYEVYSRYSEATGYSYIWNDEAYAYKLDSSVALSEEILTLIIQNIREVT